MKNQNEKSSVARIFSIIVLLGIIPAWVFYLGMRYNDTMSVVTERDRQLEEYLSMKK